MDAVDPPAGRILSLSEVEPRPHRAIGIHRTSPAEPGWWKRHPLRTTRRRDTVKAQWDEHHHSPRKSAPDEGCCTCAGDRARCPIAEREAWDWRLCPNAF